MDLAQFDDALYEALEREVYGPLYEDGLLLIANAGCGNDVGLLLNGSQRGYVGGISHEYEKLYPQDIQRRLDGSFSAILR